MQGAGWTLLLLMAVGVPVLIACVAACPASGEAELFPFEDSIFEDDVISYILEVVDLTTDIYVRVEWEDYETDLDLFLVDPQGEFVDTGVNDAYYSEVLFATPNMTGGYTLGVHAWEAWGTEMFWGNSTYNLTKVTEPFGGTISRGEERQRYVLIEDTARPLFVRIRWDFEADRLNITLEDPSGDRVEGEGDFWSTETAVFFLYFPEEEGSHLLTIRITRLTAGDDISYSATCNHPISTELKPAQPRDAAWGWYLGIILLVVASIVIATWMYISARARERGGAFTIEEVFVVHRDGRLVTSLSRAGSTPDAELMTGMLVAIRGFIEEGLRSKGQLESIRYGAGVLVMASGQHTVLAVRGTGEPSDGLNARLEEVVGLIEDRYGQLLEGWTGDASTMPGLIDEIGPLLSPTS